MKKENDEIPVFLNVCLILVYVLIFGSVILFLSKKSERNRSEKYLIHVISDEELRNIEIGESWLK